MWSVPMKEVISWGIYLTYGHALNQPDLLQGACFFRTSGLKGLAKWEGSPFSLEIISSLPVTDLLTCTCSKELKYIKISVI